MCVLLFTTAHPDYALILIDNRDEYILRPTSRPHWWTHPESGRAILSSRDLQRSEQGTWYGITKHGDLAVLTNYREALEQAGGQSISGVRSRGRMVTAWLGGLADNGVNNGVHHLVKDGGVKGVGGFSMVCGKLRKKGEGIAIVSNRAGAMDDVPVVGQDRGGIWGLSNTVFEDKNEWPKVTNGKRILSETLAQAIANESSEEALIAALFTVLDTDTMPKLSAGAGHAEYVPQLRNTIFVPALGEAKQQQAMQEARSRSSDPVANAAGDQQAKEELAAEQRPEAAPSNGPAVFETGLYGTQRQTLTLVDWEGNVTFIERALWDANGNEIPRGQGDVVERFQIEGWET